MLTDDERRRRAVKKVEAAAKRLREAERLLAGLEWEGKAEWHAVGVQEMANRMLDYIPEKRK